MEIVYGRENADMIRERHLVLDLETVDVNGTPIDLYCVIPTDKLNFKEIQDLPMWTKLHQDFIQGYIEKQYPYCLQCIEHLMGKFGGEVDSFYEIIKDRIENENKI